MHFQKNNRLSWSLTLPVMILYLLFFTVQLFFNLDIAQHYLAAPETVVHVSSTSEKQTVEIAKDAPKTSLKTKIRLNKRFQPSNIPFSVAAMAEPVFCYAKPANNCSYASVFYTSAELAVQFLRGPPVVA